MPAPLEPMMASTREGEMRPLTPFRICAGGPPVLGCTLNIRSLNSMVTPSGSPAGGGADMAAVAAAWRGRGRRVCRWRLAVLWQQASIKTSRSFLTHLNATQTRSGRVIHGTGPGRARGRDFVTSANRSSRLYNSDQVQKGEELSACGINDGKMLHNRGPSQRPHPFAHHPGLHPDAPAPAEISAQVHLHPL